MPLAMLRRRPAAFRTGLPVLAAAVLATVLATMASAPATAQPDTRLCNAEVESKLRELPLAEGDIKSVRVVEETNLDEFGPPILGVEGWVRLNRSEEHTSELQSLMRISYAVFCLKK